MWMLMNQTRYAADSTIVNDKHGARHWVVVVKGTFDICADGTTKTAEEQLPPLLAPEYLGKDGESSLRFEADMVLAKPAIDVVINASAYAPKGQPVTSVPVAIRTPAFEKTLVVHGDRVWQRDLVGAVVPSSSQPFLQMPITYERAWGGHDKTNPDPSAQKMDERNPIGTGVVTSSRNRIGMAVPNVEHPGGPSDSRGPAGYGALCSYWLPRRPYAGTYDAAWVAKRKPLLPLDFDDRFNQIAPVDQQVLQHRLGGARVELVNLTPGGVLRFDLPRVYLAMRTYFGSYARLPAREHRCVLHTVIIEPDARRVIMVWHSSLACHRTVDDIECTRIVEKPYV
jgi:hypothetical protein